MFLGDSNMFPIEFDVVFLYRGGRFQQFPRDVNLSWFNSFESNERFGRDVETELIDKNVVRCIDDSVGSEQQPCKSR